MDGGHPLDLIALCVILCDFSARNMCAFLLTKEELVTRRPKSDIHLCAKDSGPTKAAGTTENPKKNNELCQENSYV